MSAAVELILRAPLVAVGDTVHGRVHSLDPTGFTGRVELRCHVASAVPVDVVIASDPLEVSAGTHTSFALPVPAEGPITARGVTLGWSWTVALVTSDDVTLTVSPIVVTPQGGVALWLQRHAPPPA